MASWVVFQEGVVGGVIGGARSESFTVTANAPSVNEPAPPPAPMAQRSDLAKERKAVGADESAAAIDVQVRSDFRSTALWKPDFVTGRQRHGDGQRQVSRGADDVACHGACGDDRLLSSASAPRRRARTCRSSCGCRRRASSWPAIAPRSPRSSTTTPMQRCTVTPSLEIDGAALTVHEAPAEQTLRRPAAWRSARGLDRVARSSAARRSCA